MCAGRCPQAAACHAAFALSTPTRRDALEHPEQPFYIHVNPVAPHESCGPRENVTDGDSCNNMPMPATRHMHLYHDVQVPRPPNFGEKITRGARRNSVGLHTLLAAA